MLIRNREESAGSAVYANRAAVPRCKYTDEVAEGTASGVRYKTRQVRLRLPCYSITVVHIHTCHVYHRYRTIRLIICTYVYNSIICGIIRQCVLSGVYRNGFPSLPCLRFYLTEANIKRLLRGSRIERKRGAARYGSSAATRVTLRLLRAASQMERKCRSRKSKEMYFLLLNYIAKVRTHLMQSFTATPSPP